MSVSLNKPELDELVARLGHLPVWGVVSTFALDSFYDELTYDAAAELARQEANREPGRTASVVLVVSTEEGMPL